MHQKENWEIAKFALFSPLDGELIWHFHKGVKDKTLRIMEANSWTTLIPWCLFVFHMQVFYFFFLAKIWIPMMLILEKKLHHYLSEIALATQGVFPGLSCVWLTPAFWTLPCTPIEVWFLVSKFQMFYATEKELAAEINTPLTCGW